MKRKKKRLSNTLFKQIHYVNVFRLIFELIKYMNFK